MIRIQNISKTFNRGTIKALDDVFFTIKRNTMVGIIGPDGSGKTTLLRIIAGILIMDSGNINYFGNSNMPISELHKNMSYMPQKFGLYEELSVIENLNLYAKLQGVKKEEKENIFKNVLSITRLENFKDRLAGNLSGGMKQKLGLACSLLKKPKILILDEPSVGVDPISRMELIKMVNNMLAEEDTTVIWSTAYLDEAESLDHVVLLNEGKILFEGNPKEAMKNVESRVFLLKDVGINKREKAHKLMELEYIEDSVIRGQDIRVVISSGFTDKISKEFIRTTPNFEDACVDMLGGILLKKSAIDEYMENTMFEGDENVVEALHLSKKFGDFKATDNISFSVKRGKIFGLLGPNGSGKSTTFKILCGLLRQDEGTAKIVGIDITNMGSDAKMNIGYMAQKFSLYPVLSVRQNMEFFSGAYRLSGKKQKNAVDLMLKIFHLEEMEKISTGVLSLGYKQRLALACSIMHKPQVLFLDEPTSGVDPLTRKEFWIHINSMVRHGVSVIVTTHFMDEAENCDDIALVYKGKIRAAGSPDDIKNLYKGDGEPTLENAFINVIEDSI
ncbi:MAG: ATP-binding cassette domain-containing protein [Holosporales bacterium]|jgi:ABC-2 type transport system ATP-binding protein|nr:ATP-binding cassette domain-containing protein [Holosporales bacterium]